MNSVPEEIDELDRKVRQLEIEREAIRREKDQGRIEELTREKLENYRLEGTDERIPLFDEVLALFEDATPLIIELKAAGGNHFALAKAVCERLDSYQGEFCIESFDPFALIDVKKFRPAICRAGARICGWMRYRAAG